MNTKIKIFIVGTIALWGLFNSFNNNVSAQTVVAHCDSATLTGTVYPNGSPTEAWFDWGPTIPPAYHTARRTFYSTSSYSDIITGLTPSTRYFYRAMAQNAGGLATGDTKDFYTPACPVPNPTVNIYANPSSIQYGGNSTLSWSSINATSCSAVWTTSTAISGSKVVFPTSTSAYSIICTGPGGDASDSVSVTVSDPPQTPTVTISANPISVSYNGSSILTWSSTDSTSCSATDAWSGTKATSGSQSTGNLTSSKTYTLTCAGAGGNATDSVTVIVYPILQPSVNLEANPINIKSGEISTLFWNSSNAISCSASWTTSTATSGSKTIYPTSTTTYSITCNGASGSTPASDSVTVKVEPQILKPPPPTGLTATAVSQTQINLSWNASSGATSYDVYRIESDHALSYIGSSSVPSYSSTGLSCGYVDPYTGTGYRFVVTASNAGGTSDLSNMAIATTDACTPGAVTIGSASPTSQTAMNVTWTRNSPFTETGFKIYQYQPELNPLRGTAGTGATSGSATSLACGTPYRFYVQSYVTTNGRTYTAPGISGITKEATTDPCTPAPPTGVTATPMNQQQIWVNWNSVPGASGYAIFVCSATPAYPGCTPDLWLVWQSNIGKSVVPYSASGCGGFGGYRVKTSVDGGGGRRYYSNFSSAAYATADLCTSAPTVNLSADDTNIDYNASTYIRWNSTNTTSCSASGGNSGWAGSKSFSGSFYTGSLYDNVTYTIRCSNDTGSADDSITIVVNENEEELNPTVDITASDQDLNYGDSTYIRWTSNNATSCSATGGTNSWSGTKSTSGSFYTGALYDTEIYTIRCSNSSASASDSVTIYVEDEDDEQPTVNTRAATNIDEESATLNGFVDSNGGSNVEAWFEWGTDNDYDNHTSHINYGHTSGTDFDYDLDGLDSDETYYFRAVAQNDSGERVFGSQKSFRTDEDGNNNDNEEGPNVTTYSATDVQNDSAILNGYVDTNGTSTRRWFEWGTSRSSLSHETDKSSKSTSSRNFEQSIDNLNPDTTYYFRAVAENNNDIDYGNILSFRTESDYEDNACDYGTCTPTAVTIMVSNVGQSSARLNGLGLVNNNVYTTGYFEYGTTQALGSVTINKNIGSTQSNPFYESLFNLVSGRIYYYQAVVINQYGTSRGDIVSFRTTSPTVYIDTNTNTNTVYRNTTVVTNTNNTAGTSRPSLVLLNVSRDGETIRRGDIIEYVVNYKNVSSKNLRDVVLRISIPKELEFMEASRGYFSTENSTVVANIGNLDSQEEGSVNVRVQVTTDTEVGKIVVVTANLAYTIIDNSAQEEVFAYSKNTIGDREVVQQGALAFLFGDGFLPNTLLGWLLIILLIVLLILAVRKAYYESKTLAVSDASKKHS